MFLSKQLYINLEQLYFILVDIKVRPSCICSICYVYIYEYYIYDHIVGKPHGLYGVNI